ncbi:MAG: hypothetical protein M3409_07290 [Gemmatimonadota bacterium]|nr:hypothetical protein [Gemmatimonadota bacterium]
MKQRSSRGRALLGATALAVGMGMLAGQADAQWVQENEQFYLPAAHNWVFRQNYSGADRLFNAFDYGHAILYETLYTDPGAPAAKLEVDEYNFLTQRLLKRPPRVPLEEGAIEIAYVKIAPEAKLMFEWAHLLHRQLYDVLADERLTQAEKDADVAELVAYYKTRPDIAFSSVPKSMELMDGQFYSLAFREKYPKFNGLIWAYHWLQVGLYEPLMVNTGVAGRTKGVNATVGRFWQMLEDAPETMPYLMPMTAGVAPTFAARYPEAAIIFDNLHMMHDIISDILTSPEVPRGAKRAEILRAAQFVRDDTSFVMSFEQWQMMGEMMGVNNMGGPAVGFLAALPEPTVPRGMSMAGMDHGAMGGMQGMQHGNMAMPQQGEMQGMQHGNMAMPQQGQMQGMQMQGMQHGNMQMGGTVMQGMMEMHARMMQDPVIRERVATDPMLQRMMQQMPGMTQQMQPGHMMPMERSSMGGMEMAREADRRRAMEFIVLLLSDPEVASRVHSDPELHRLWSDPEVQARLQELQQTHPELVTPAPTTSHPHPQE